MQSLVATVTAILASVLPSSWFRRASAAVADFPNNPLVVFQLEEPTGPHKVLARTLVECSQFHAWSIAGPRWDSDLAHAYPRPQVFVRDDGVFLQPCPHQPIEQLITREEILEAGTPYEFSDLVDVIETALRKLGHFSEMFREHMASQGEELMAPIDCSTCSAA